ncbi:MAG: anion permease [Anaeromicrobium sp.]|uniref:inorganic phosphate transporter n=1 Tax=Anaeromicrobium sp. TaxID=1929132 RepID=UPI0025F7BD2E|nr:inorganic phosphate transporter [Anaeromicrobium sp.]MCT4595279.1 anion permease [Anaeromicrobium sp.]
MFSVLLIPLLVAMFLGINMGGSGTAPSFSVAYGADLINIDLIPVLFGVCVLIGAIVASEEVTKTIGKGIISENVMSITVVTIILLSTSLSIMFANILKVPQSASQATVFAITGVGIYFDQLKTQRLFFEIIPTWFILPIIAFMIMYIIGKYIFEPLKCKKTINFIQISEKSLWKYIVILSSCYVAFSIGANNVANATGPITSMLLNELGFQSNTTYSLLCMILATIIVAPCFGIGSSIFGSSVLETTGKKIISVAPLGAVVISIVTGSLFLVASVTKGIPASLVQLNTGAIIGLATAKLGFKEVIKNSSVRKIFVVWIIAPIISFLLAILFLYLGSKLNMF